MRKKLLFYVAVWKRPEITEICFMGISRLRRVGIHDVSALAVISETSMIDLCVKYGVDYVMHKNYPLGEKKNAGLKRALEKGFDYLIDIGSDDLLKDEFLSLYPFEKDVYGLRDFVMMNSETGECRRLNDRDARFGVGRAISRRAVESLGKLWNDNQNHGLDNWSEFELAKAGFLGTNIRSEEPLAIDIKSEVNLWPFNYLMGAEYPLDSILQGLSDQEKTAIKCLVSSKTSVPLIDA